MNSNYPWETSYMQAILETNHLLLPRRVDEAQAAIDARLRDLALDGHGSPEERTAIQDALSGLKVLRNERQAPKVD